MNKWELEMAGGDVNILVRQINGRITKARYKLINRWARKNSVRSEYCGHAHDCCGCHVRTWVDVEFTKNSATLTMTEYFNY